MPDRVLEFMPAEADLAGSADLPEPAELSRWLDEQAPAAGDLIVLQARPPRAALAGQLVTLLRAHPTAVAAVPSRAVTETLKRVDGAGRVTGTVDRQAYRQVELPQAFRAGPLRRALALVARTEQLDPALLPRLARTEGDLVELPLDQPGS